MLLMQRNYSALTLLISLVKMDANFMSHLNPLIQLSERIGLTYINDRRFVNTMAKIFNRIMRLSLGIIYISSVYEYAKSVYSDNEMSEVVRIGDIIGMVGAVSCILFKWLYHYIKRKQMMQIILKVRTLIHDDHAKRFPLLLDDGNR